MVWYGLMVWYGVMVWYDGMLWYGLMVWYGAMVWYDGMLWYGMVLSGMVCVYVWKIEVSDSLEQSVRCYEHGLNAFVAEP